jgi:outer membrane receptor protein involved in Fe transport
MKFTLCGASGVAILAGLAGALPAWGQQIDTSQTISINNVSGPQQAAAPAQPDQTRPAAAADKSVDKVVVTGSFIKGSAEDAALPVEVYSQEEQEKQGSPTALDFVKSLSISGPTTGEAYYFGGAGNTGSPRINLRGIGADRTLTLLNGRRMSSNVANMPAIAIARTEILKDGAAVTYGADATGGVVNYITRDDYRGFTVSGNYKGIKDSNGDYDLHAMAGFGGGDTNFLVAAEWEHRSRLNTQDRKFSSLPYNVNPAPWSATTNLSSYTPRGALPAVPTVANEFGAAAGAAKSDFTQASCEGVGGVFAGTSCLYDYISYYNLVEQQDIYRVFAQVNSKINDHMDFHGEVAFGEVQAPEVFGSPSQPGNVRGPALATGGTNQYYVPTTNPFVNQFAADTGLSLTGVSGLTMGSFRPFAHNGNIGFYNGTGYGTPSKIDNQIWRVSAGLKGDLGEWAGVFKDVAYDLGVTYNSANLFNDTPDILGFRLQQALNGFGGPNCNAADLDPVRLGTQNPAAAGKNGCLWFNPFSTSFTKQPELNLNNINSGTNRGLTAPAGTTGWENSQDLVRWLFGDNRSTETINNDLTIDYVMSSETPLKLPGGNVNVAVGAQWRQVETRTTASNDFYNGNTPCEWPNQYGEIPRNPADPAFNGCTPDNPGPYIFFSTVPNNYADRQSTSIFGEASLPVTNDLNFQVAVRREDFSGGLGATVYKVSGKYNLLGGPLSFRGSYGTNYAAPAVTLIPGRVVNGVASITKAGSAWLGTQTVTRSDIVPETAKSWDAGIIWSSRGLTEDSDFRVLLDYFDIQTKDQIGALATTTILGNYIFGASSTNTGTAKVLNCADPITSNNVIWQSTATAPNGQCITGVTQASDINVLKLQTGNGPGQHTAGLDLTVDYSFSLGAFNIALGTTVTNVETFTFSESKLDGVALDKGDKRLGQLNFATTAGAVPRWRGNVFANVGLGDHNLRATVNYISSVRDERTDLSPNGQALVVGGSQTQAFTTYGVNTGDYTTVDLVYQLKLPADFTVTAAISNLFDKDPPQAREEFGYDPLMGDPLGRVIQVGLKKTF